MNKYLLRSEFNASEFINTYILTIQEYSMLDFKSRMIYGERMFGSILCKLPNIGNEITIKGCIHPAYFEFFEWFGITCENTTGNVVRCKLKRISYGNYSNTSYSKSDIDKLDAHIYNIAKTKAEIILNHTYDPNINANLISLENFYNSLDDELKYAYADSIYGRLIDSFYMNIGETRFINVEIPECFDDYFTKKGYILRRMSDNSGKKILCIKTALAAKEKISINTNERLMAVLNEREELIRRLSKQSTSLFTPEYANIIRSYSPDLIKHIGEYGGLSHEELQSIINAECAMLMDIYKENGFIKLENINKSYQSYIDKMGMTAKSIKPFSYKLELK